VHHDSYCWTLSILWPPPLFLQQLQAADDIQALLTAILHSDSDCDSILTDKELDGVMMRMRVFNGRTGSKFDEKALRAAFKQSLTKKGASLIRIHSSMQEESVNNEEEEQPEPVAVAPVQTLQRIPRLDDTKRPPARGDPEISNASVSTAKLISTGLGATTSGEMYGSESQPIELFSVNDDIEKSDKENSRNVANPSDDIVLNNLLAMEEFDSVGGNKVATQSIGYILQSFSGAIGAEGLEQTNR
jgi:hypothetical protein